MEGRERLPPIWLMGFVNLPVGVSGALTLMTLPQLLAARGVPEPRIAEITGLFLAPFFFSFLLAPILDVRFRRRTYAIGFLVATTVLIGAALLDLGDLKMLSLAMVLGSICLQQYVSAAAGWAVSIVPKAKEDVLATWMVVANVGGFGVTSVVGITLVRALPFAAGATIATALLLLPFLLFPWMPAPAPDAKLARERFGEFVGELVALVKRPSVLRILVLFVLPAASFALTNTLGGLGTKDFGASEQLVGLIAGVGVTGAGLLGCLAVPAAVKRISPRSFYLLVGGVGSVLTLGLIGLPRTPAVFALALIVENVAQSAALTTANVITLREIGPDNPLSATIFAVLTSAASLPIAYMQVLDGQAYGVGGLDGAYVADGGLGLASCLVLAFFLLRWRRREATAS
jgi:PAT family beta-lactamase induction signal transducer AmpG